MYTMQNLVKHIFHFARRLYCQSTTVAIRQQLRQMNGGSVHLTKDDITGIATVVIKNPGRKNAFTGNMMVDFEDCVRELESWNRGRGVILTGANGTFCSGGDFDTVSKIVSGGIDMQMSAYVQDATSRLFNLPMISLAVIDGYALGGGAELSTACDFRIITPTAKISFVHVKLNIATAFGGCTRLVKLVGRTNALQILSSGKIMNADDAYRLGLVSDIVNEDADTAEIGKQWLLRHLWDNES